LDQLPAINWCPLFSFKSYLSIPADHSKDRICDKLSEVGIFGRARFGRKQGEIRSTCHNDHWTQDPTSPHQARQFERIHFEDASKILKSPDQWHDSTGEPKIIAEAIINEKEHPRGTSGTPAFLACSDSYPGSLAQLKRIE